MTNKIKRAGRAIGGGKLWHVIRAGEVIGTIVETRFCGVVTQYSLPSERPHTVHETLADARAEALSW